MCNIEFSDTLFKNILVSLLFRFNWKFTCKMKTFWSCLLLCFMGPDYNWWLIKSCAIFLTNRSVFFQPINLIIFLLPTRGRLSLSWTINHAGQQSCLLIYFQCTKMFIFPNIRVLKWIEISSNILVKWYIRVWKLGYYVI